jgi:hypothetical protein
MENHHLFARAGKAAAALLAMSFMSGSTALAAGAMPDISGTWWATEYHGKLELIGGGPLPLNAKGKAAYENYMAGLKDGSVTDVARKFCVPDGVPRVLDNPYPFEIIQDPPEQTTIVYELNHQVRTVFMDKAVPTYKSLVALPYYNGHSYGHWDGNTLVVTTLGFTDSPKTFLDATGAPHTDMLVTTERIRKTSPTALEDLVTIHDPDYYTKDFSTRFTYTLHNDIHLQDYICGETHRDISGIKGIHPQPPFPTAAQ